MSQHYHLSRNRFDLIDDDEKKFVEESYQGFIQHRHPQSVLSIIFKQNKCDLISAYESEWALDENKKRTWIHLSDYPIIAKRDMKVSPIMRFISRQIKTLYRIKKKLTFKN